MKTTFRLCTCALVLTGLCATIARAGDPPAKTDTTAPKAADTAKKVDNPQYKHWTQFKPGAFAVLKMTGKAMGMDTEITMTQTLKSLTAEKAVIERTMVQKMMGQETKMPPMTEDILPKVPEAEAKAQTEPEGKVGEGEETLTILGKKLKTKWTEVKVTKQGMTVFAKTWTSEDIPGQVVKVESHTEGAMTMSSTGEVVEFGTQAKAADAEKAPAKDAKDGAKDAKKAGDKAEKDGDKAKKADKDAKKDKP